LLWLQERLRDRLTQVAMTDALTGALNRHGVMPLLERELQRARRHGRPVSVVLCDLDHFKRVNDQHGHQTGDAVLCRFVRETRAMLRGGDLLARWGGEEFLVVLPETAMTEAVLVAERVRQAQRRATADGLPMVTVSGGVATAPGPVHGYDVDTLLAVADHRLYVAKETRDRIVSTGLAAAPAGAGREAAAPALLPLADVTT
jgi:diguanylate cyclase (GGDEF)-like protein